MWPVEIRTLRFEPALSRIAQDGGNGVIRGPGGAVRARARIGASALTHKIPVLAHVAEEVPSGLLMSYGQDLPDFFRRAVAYTDRISKAQNLPIFPSATNKIQTGAESQERESIRSNFSADAHHQRRRGGRVTSMSVIGPKRTSLVAPHMSAFGGKADITHTLSRWHGPLRPRPASTIFWRPRASFLAHFVISSVGHRCRQPPSSLGRSAACDRPPASWPGVSIWRVEGNRR